MFPKGHQIIQPLKIFSEPFFLVISNWFYSYLKIFLENLNAKSDLFLQDRISWLLKLPNTSFAIFSTTSFSSQSWILETLQADGPVVAGVSCSPRGRGRYRRKAGGNQDPASSSAG